MTVVTTEGTRYIIPLHWRQRRTALTVAVTIEVRAAGRGVGERLGTDGALATGWGTPGGSGNVLCPGTSLRGEDLSPCRSDQTAVSARPGAAKILAFHLLFDSASAAFCWDCLIDAMAEFGGAPAGLLALEALVEG